MPGIPAPVWSGSVIRYTWPPTFMRSSCFLSSRKEPGMFDDQQQRSSASMPSRISWSDRLRNRESTGKTGLCCQRSRCVSDPSVTGGCAPSLPARCSSRISCSGKDSRSTAASISVSALMRGNLVNKTSSLCLLNLISTSIPAETLSSQPVVLRGRLRCPSRIICKELYIQIFRNCRVSAQI